MTAVAGKRLQWTEGIWEEIVKKALLQIQSKKDS